VAEVPLVQRVAMLSMHTSPLSQPGTGDGGGMNVYVRELSSALARAGVACQVFTRRYSPDLPPVVSVEPGLVVRHVPAGPPAQLPKEELPDLVDEFAAGVAEAMEANPVDAIHANYWLSGVAGHALKHRFEVPLVSTFHTLDRLKVADDEDLIGQVRRAQAESEVMACSDAIVASCSVEARQIGDLYDVDPSRIQVVPLGVNHAFFSPGDKAQARRALGLPAGEPMCLFVGRLQPLKGARVAIEALAELGRGFLVIIGGPSGPDGPAEVEFLHELAAKLGVSGSVHFLDPQPHELLSTFYRAADCCLVPSRSESFGLVALEASACGTPVVASAVGGLLTLVDDEVTGYLVEDRDPRAFAERVARILDDPALAQSMSRAAARRAREYTWRDAAHSLIELYAAKRSLVECG